MNTLLLTLNQAQTRFIDTILKAALISIMVVLFSLKQCYWKPAEPKRTLQPVKKNGTLEFSIHKFDIIGPYDDDGECF